MRKRCFFCHCEFLKPKSLDERQMYFCCSGSHFLMLLVSSSVPRCDGMLSLSPSLFHIPPVGVHSVLFCAAAAASTAGKLILTARLSLSPPVSVSLSLSPSVCLSLSLSLSITLRFHSCRGCATSRLCNAALETD